MDEHTQRYEYWRHEAEWLADNLARIAAGDFHGDLEAIGIARRALQHLGDYVPWDPERPF